MVCCDLTIMACYGPLPWVLQSTMVPPFCSAIVPPLWSNCYGLLWTTSMGTMVCYGALWAAMVQYSLLWSVMVCYWSAISYKYSTGPIAYPHSISNSKFTNHNTKYLALIIIPVAKALLHYGSRYYSNPILISKLTLTNQK